MDKEPDSIVCATCGRTIEFGVRRCSYCLTDIRAVEPLSGEEAVSAKVHRARVMQRDHRRKQLIKLIRITGFVFSFIFVVFWVYSTFISEVGTLPTATTNLSGRLSSDAGWENSDGGSGRLRRSLYASRIEQPIAWETQLPANAETSLVADSQNLYVSLSNGLLIAYSQSNGVEIWRRQFDNFLFTSPLAIENVIFVPSANGILYALDSSNGNELWSVEAGPLLESTPLIYDGRIYLFGKDVWYVFDAGNGQKLLEKPMDTVVHRSGRRFESPVMNDNYIAVGLGQKLLIFDRLTGEQTYWYNSVSFPTKIAIDNDEVISISPWLIFSVNENSRNPWWEGRLRSLWLQLYVWGVAPPTPLPERLWGNFNPPRLYFAPAVSSTSAYVAGERASRYSTDALIQSYNRSDGTINWKQTLDQITSAPLITSDGLLIAAGSSLVLLDPDSGELIKALDYKQDISSPISIKSGTYYIVGGNSIHALK
tara:strand:- start:287 stop:1729 length:1443 start_codon:yes stop_codon:yes gene_type:complete